MSLPPRMVNTLWRTANAPAAIAFNAGLGMAHRTQLNILRGYLRASEGTAFAAEHGLNGATTVEEFRSRVPLRTYDEFAPYLDRISAGESSVLTHESVDRFVPSSGSTSAAKFIPHTRTLLREFRRGIAPWINNLFRAHPDLVGGPAYWSVSPVGRRHEPRGVIPVGFDDDAAYVGAFSKLLASSVLVMPSDVRLIQSIPTWRYVTLLFLLRARGLRLISVWHPSFLELLLDELPRVWASLLKDIAAGTCTPPDPLDSPLADPLAVRLTADRRRAVELRALTPAQTDRIWPHLRVLSCWADAHASMHARTLAGRCPNVTIQPKGIVSTEAFISLPLGDMHPLAIRSHFFEFVADSGEMLLASELMEGQSYSVVVTTGGGLWRYRLQDRVVVDGFVRSTPSVRFLGKEDLVVDLRGEKLSEGLAARVISELCDGLASPPAFAMLAPEDPGCGEPPGYVLYIESNHLPALFGEQLETHLRANPHYAYARDLGQLAAARVVQVAAGASAVFLEAERTRGIRMGDIKAVALSRHADWSARFAGAAANGPAARPIHARC